MQHSAFGSGFRRLVVSLLAVCAAVAFAPAASAQNCTGDIFANGIVDGADLGALLSEWGPVTPLTNSDLDGNGQVNGADLGILLAHWGPCGG